MRAAVPDAIARSASRAAARRDVLAQVHALLVLDDAPVDEQQQRGDQDADADREVGPGAVAVELAARRRRRSPGTRRRAQNGGDRHPAAAELDRSRPVRPVLAQQQEAAEREHVGEDVADVAHVEDREVAEMNSTSSTLTTRSTVIARAGTW